MPRFTLTRLTARLLTRTSIVVALSLLFASPVSAVDPCAVPSFTGPTHHSQPAPRAIVAADFNKDGKLDFAAADNRTIQTVTVRLGDGNGGFGERVTFQGGSNANFLATGDLNGDGNPDLVTSNDDAAFGAFTVLLGDGTGGFGAPIAIFDSPGGGQNTSVAIADVNGDGKADLIASNSTLNTIRVLFGDGAGNVTTRIAFSSGGVSPRHLVMADLNADGKLDVVAANQFSDIPNQGNVATLLGDGAGNFSAARTFAIGGGPTSLTVGDFNGDGKPDVASVHTGSVVSVLLGDGTGNLGTPVNYSSGGVNPNSVVKGDFNSDGKTDLAVFNGRPGNVVIFAGDGLGGFSAVANFDIGTLSLLSGTPAAGVAVAADFNADGRLDLAAANELPGLVAVLLNDCGTPAPNLIQFSVNAFSGSEGNGFATAFVKRTGAVTGVASVIYATSNGTAIFPLDYVGAAGTLTFGPGETFKTITFSLFDDNLDETTETFTTLLSNATGSGTLGPQQSTTILVLDNDPTPSISINDVTVAEGNSGTKVLSFFVSLSNPSGSPISLNYASTDGSAVAGGDYQSVSSSLTFNPGEITRNINITVNGDTSPEANETFFVNLSSPTNATLSDVQGQGTIADDDSAPTPDPSPSPVQYSVTGLVSENGVPVSNVTITLAMEFQGTPSTKVITTDAFGIYNSGELGCQNNVGVTPSKTGLSFNPLRINFVSSSQCLGGTGNASFIASLTPNVTQLSAPNYSIGEAAGNAQVVVTRTDTTGSATVDYATSDFAGLNECNVVSGLGSSRCDYATSFGTLRFAAGESSKTIFIPLVDDRYADGSEAFTITLSNPSGMTLGTNRTATITIQDNDATTGANPIDGTDFFIRQQYIDFLGREPDPGGLAGWRNVLNNCGITVAQPCDRIEVSAGFFRSEEFQSRGYFIYRFFSALGRIPLSHEFYPDFAKVSGFLTPEQLEANKVAYVNEVMAREDFQTKYGSTLNNPTAYVEALLQTVGLPLHPAKQSWINTLTASNTITTRGQVLRQLVESVEVYNKYYNEAFVIMQYFGYLRRTADASYLSWINTMNQTNGDYRTMINGFMNSAEYRRRFGP